MRGHIIMPAAALDTSPEAPVHKRSRALVLYSTSGPYRFEPDWERPRIGADELLIDVKAIGLNPIDWKCVAFGFGVHSTPWISGREAAGVVDQVGSQVNSSRKGDRVFVTSTNYRDNRTSTFQKCIVAKPFNVGRLPDQLSFEEGATLGVGCVTAASALFDALAIPQSLTPPGERGSPWILVWGGSCVTGMMMIQLAKQTGFRVFVVASLQNADYLDSLGADRVADRHDPEKAIAEIHELDIDTGVDCVGQETATFCARALRPGGRLAYLVKGPNEEIMQERRIDATDILLKRFHENPAYGQSVVDFISNRLFSQTLKPVRHQRVEGGFEGIEKGLELLKDQKISGCKLVVPV